LNSFIGIDLTPILDNYMIRNHSGNLTHDLLNGHNLCYMSLFWKSHFGKYFVQPSQWSKEGLIRMRFGHFWPITWPKDSQHLEISNVLNKWEVDLGGLGVPPFDFHILAFHVGNMFSFFCIHFKSWFFIQHDSTCKKHLSSWKWHFVVHLESWSCTHVMVATILILVLILVKG
jgi:hypothetical protein